MATCYAAFNGRLQTMQIAEVNRAKGNIMSRLGKVSLIGLAFIAAVVLALVSASFVQVGPESVQYGDSDYRPVMKGGFPVAYLFDAPGISVERQLSFIEDMLSLGALILDITIYFGLILLVILAVPRRR